MHANYSWDERYKAGPEALPWDTGMPAPELVEFYKTQDHPPAQVLEIGCGTGTNAIWMAEKGSKVVATDISPTAIELAKKKKKKERVEVDFRVSDILKKAPLPDDSADFVFDRGVYHVMEPQNREAFIIKVAKMIKPGAFWLCLAGSADQMRDPEEMGPPQLKASELIDLAEEKFEIHKLLRGSFILPDGSSHLAWKVLYRKR